MTDCDPTSPSGDIPPGSAPPPLRPATSPGSSASSTSAKRERRPRSWRMTPNRRIGRIVVAAVMAPVIGLSVGLATSSSAVAAPTESGSAAVGAHGFGGGSNARSGPAAGGASGTVSSVSKSGITVTTSAGQAVTVDEEASTLYKKGSNSASKSAIKKGKQVLVLGTTSGTTIKATQVIVQTTGGGSTSSTAAEVVPFQRGRAVHVQAGRYDPGQLQPGVGDDRRRNDSEQGDGSCARRIPGGHRRPGGEVEQWRVRGPLHRRQLAPPRLRQSGLRGHRCRLVRRPGSGAGPPHLHVAPTQPG